MRKKLIENKLTQVIDDVNLVSENLPDNFNEFKVMGLAKDGIYKRLESAIESILDVCAIINSDLGLGMPEAEENILDNLEFKKIFDKKILDLIKEMKKFRNILVHRYGKINDETAFEDIKEGSKDFELIIEETERFLEKHKARLNNRNGKKK